MALEGTLKDFSLPDILQLIGLQKKTGILTLRHKKEEARILFMNGMVVGAESSNQKLENRLGRVLVKTNRISQGELDQALEVQSKTLQRLGQVLVQKGFIKPQDLHESLQIQVTEIIYRLFRWTDGEYHFNPESTVEYDHEHITPIGSESILMEGMRMLDEWPMIEKVIDSFDMLLERTPRGRSVRLNIDKRLSLEPARGESFDTLLRDVMEDGEQEVESEDSLKLSHDQELILKLIDGPTLVQDIIDRSGANEFDTCRNLYDLYNMDLIQHAVTEDSETSVREIVEERHIPFWIPASLLIIISLFSFGLGWNPVNFYFKTPSEILLAPSQQAESARYRLYKIEDAIDLFFLEQGRLPFSLDQLVRESMLDANDLVDPLGLDGDQFRYELIMTENSYRLFSLHRSRAQDEESLLITKTFPLAEEVKDLGEQI